MRKWWIGVALTVGWLGAAAAGRAQGPIPEPLPTWSLPSAGQMRPMTPGGVMPAGGPQMGMPGVPPPGALGGLPPGMPGSSLPGMPNGPLPGQGGPPLGPLNPYQAPPGPGPDLSISGGSHGAFMDEQPNLEKGCFFHLGAMALSRQRLGRGPVAYTDVTLPIDLDTGIPPIARNARVINDWNDVDPDMAFGPTATIGWVFDNQAIELSGFYIVEHSDIFSTQRIGGQFIPFINIPIGFEGDNGLWSQADLVQTQLWSNVASGELNYRCWSGATIGPELILGARYFGVDERVSILTDDDFLSVRDVNGFPDPLRRATYSVRTKNRLIGPQAGVEWNCQVHSCFAFSFLGKVALAANLLESSYNLKRGDDFQVINVKTRDTLFSQMFQIGANFDLIMFERMKVRAGYNAFWVTNVAEAVDQVNYSLSGMKELNDNGSIFYHGPTVEVQLFF